jgi:phosphatidylethanolamine-binding protein (PEBP) family uncharacterized protein
MALALSLIGGTVSAAMSLTSTDIRPGLAIPVAHIYTRCGGENISPNLAWSGAPRGMSFVLTMIDVDVKPDEWSHWIVVGLPAVHRLGIADRHHFAEAGREGDDSDRFAFKTGA